MNKLLTCTAFPAVLTALFFIGGQGLGSYSDDYLKNTNTISSTTVDAGSLKSGSIEKKESLGVVARKAVIKEMQAFIGTPYGTGPGELVCNIAIARACENAGYPFHLALAHDLYKSWPRVEGYGTSGDVWFFTHQFTAENPRIAHVMLVSDIKENEATHASSSRGVIRSKLDFKRPQSYWPKRHVGASRIPSLPQI